ncbi:ATP-binding cassette domain-containing protein [Thiotrichales bacterium 19S3-7]|nr:ATP-binding cassette domain-containing protein [Thiotrichales bacterium 19S3-7]MCF6801630.1 ATP-binding cassette domain-containing protein [Thiotrichales bacterium 19S3-11]
MHQPIFLDRISLGFSDKSCFEDFTGYIYPDSRIAIIGNNGSGKSSLLNILRGKLAPSGGEVILPKATNIGYVEQTIDHYEHLSGAQRLHKKLSQALAVSPDILLLDEPTNHLDCHNRKSLIRMLKNFHGTLIVATHDIKLLNSCFDGLWHIHNNQIHQHTGTYHSYLHQHYQKQQAIEHELVRIKKEKQQLHQDLMKEQKRAAKSKQKGKKSIHNKKWPTVVSTTKASRSQQTTAKKQSTLNHKRHTLIQQKSLINPPKAIAIKFSITSDKISQHTILSVHNADIGYATEKPVLKAINLSLKANERIHIAGDNTSGKSTLLKAIISDKQIIKTGDWYLPKHQTIGYLDQHYNNLKPKRSVIDHLREVQPHWDDQQLRHHLNDFLFSNTESISKLITFLSGGEKMRLSLCMIAAKTPNLLILDEITNNIDLETKNQLINVLEAYPGAIIIVSHESEFLKSLSIDTTYKLQDQRLLTK